DICGVSSSTCVNIVCCCVVSCFFCLFFFFSSRRRHTRLVSDWSSDVCSSDLAPQAATIDFYKSKGGIPDSGPLSISVPGAVGGAAMALKKYGTRPLGDVLAPAIEIAEQGFPITESLARGLAGSKEKLEKWPSTTKIWFKDGKPLQTGDVLVNSSLARTLRTIAAQGPDAFYRGEIAKTTAAYLKANGGIITEADLRSYEPYEDAPVHVNYRGTEVYECPPNSQGFVML